MGAIGVVGAVIVAIVVARSQSAGTNVPTTPPPAVNVQALSGLVSGPPPWPAEIEHLRARLDAIGVPARAGLTLHVHQHLDVFVNGKRVVVPAGIGIGDGFLSPLHTHDESGVDPRRVHHRAELFARGVLRGLGCPLDEDVPCRRVR